MKTSNSALCKVRKITIPKLFFRDQIANIHWLIDKRKRITEKKSALLTMPKPLTMWMTTNYGKFFKRWESQTILPASRKTCMQVKKQQLEPDMEQQTVPNWERSTSRLYFVTLLI